MKTTAVVESLSTIQPDVLFLRLPAYFKTISVHPATIPATEDYHTISLYTNVASDPNSDLNR